MQTLFSWLHLSDIHSRHGGDDHQAEQREVLRSLEESLARLPDDLERVDAIFVTGDIGFSGGARDAEEYAAAAEWLRRCAARLGVAADRVFVVAGNHDVDRKVAATSAEFQQHLDALRSGDAQLSGRAQEHVGAFMRRFERFREFLMELNPQLAARLDGDGAWSLDVEVPALPLRLVGLNTALLCQDDTDEGRLRIGWRQFEHVAGAERFVLALGHHPFSWLADSPNLLGPLRRRIDVFLHGHVHRQQAFAVVSGGGDMHVTAVAGAVHLDEREVREHAGGLSGGSHAYLFGALVGDSGRPSRLRVWPRIYRPTRGFVVDSENSIPEQSYAEVTLARFASGVIPTPSIVAPVAVPVRVVAFRSPLDVYVAFHPASAEGSQFATMLYGLLHRSVEDVLDQTGFAIPVFFRSASTAEQSMPAPVPLDRADRTAIIALVDRHTRHDENFRRWLRAQLERASASGGRASLLPIALEEAAIRIAGLAEHHHVRADGATGRDRENLIADSVLHHLVRLLRSSGDAASVASPPPVEVFLSHARKDGAEIADQLRGFLHNERQMQVFLDRRHLAPGYSFLAEIGERLAQSHVVFLAILTDDFASRDFCRQEVATARLERRPIVVVDARSRTRMMNLPLLGAVPGLRFRPDDPEFWSDLTRMILGEALRHAFIPAYLRAVEQLWGVRHDRSIHVPRMPDTADVVPPDADRLLHPDPPLLPVEARVFQGPFPALSIVTPSTLPLKLP